MKRNFEATNSNQNYNGKDKQLRREVDKDDSNKLNPDPEIELDEEANVNLEREEVGGTARKQKGRTSWVWSHFEIRFSEDQKTQFAHCKHCQAGYKLSGKTNAGTGNLNVHMKTKHLDLLPDDIRPNHEKFVFSQERYREALVKWIVLSSQPFSECEIESFLEMIATLNPDAHTISKETVKRDIMKKFDDVVKEIKLKLSKSQAKFSFTVDAWTSKNVLPFLAIRAHWINSDWQYETVLLDFSYIEGNHSGLNFSTIFLECLKRFDIPLSKVLGVTVDNAGNNDTLIASLEKHGIKAATKFSSMDNRVRCMPHILNLCVQDILKSLKIPLNFEDEDYKHSDDEEIDATEDDEQEAAEEEDEETEDIAKSDEDVKEVLDEDQFSVVKLRHLIRKVKNSTQMRQKLRKLCLFYKIRSLVPIIDVATRWNSTYEMIERAAFLKAPLRALCSNEKSLKKFLTTETEWNDLSSLKKLLSKFDHATKLMSMERRPTICSYLPTLNWLLESLETFIDTNTGLLAHAARQGLVKLKKYEVELQLNKSKIPYVAIFLNPSLKMSYFKEHGYSKQSIKDIQKSISEIFEKTYAAVTPNQNDNIPEDEPEPDEFFAHLHKRSVNKEPKEFQKYLHFLLSAPKVDVMQFWRSQKEEFSNITNMARDYLAVQGSAVAVERDNSVGADLVTATRCSMLPETIQACMCLKSWLKNINGQFYQSGNNGPTAKQ